MDMGQLFHHIEDSLVLLLQARDPLPFKNIQWALMCTYMADKRLSDLVAHTKNARDLQGLIEWIQKRRAAEAHTQHGGSPVPRNRRASRREMSPPDTNYFVTMEALEHVLERMQRDQYKWQVSLCQDFNAIARKLKYDIADHGEYLRKEWSKQAQVQLSEIESMNKSNEAELDSIRNSQSESIEALTESVAQLHTTLENRDAELSAIRNHMSQLSQQNMIYFCTIGLLMIYLVFLHVA
jgi:hypothetical protein